MAALNKIIQGVAQNMQLKFDNSKLAAYGSYRGFSIVINTSGLNSRPMYAYIRLCANHDGIRFSGSELKDNSVVSDMDIEPNGEFGLLYKILIKGNNKDNINKLSNAVQGIIDRIIQYSGVNCDERGEAGMTSVYLVKGEYRFLNNNSAAAVSDSLNRDKAMEDNKSENYVLGIVGALIGSLIGVICTLILGLLGWAAVVSGLVMGIAIVFLYKKLGHKFSIISVVLCCGISVAMTYFSFRLYMRIDLYKDLKKYGFKFGYCFRHAKDLYEFANEMSTYNHNFWLIMLMGIIGSVATIVLEYKGQKEQFELHRLS